MDTSANENALEQSQELQKSTPLPPLVLDGMELARALSVLVGTGTGQTQEELPQGAPTTVEYDPMRYPLFF